MAFERLVAQPSVGMDHTAGSIDSPTKAIRLSPEASAILRIRIRPMAVPSSSVATYNQRFSIGLAAPHALLLGAQVGLVDLYAPAQSVASRPHHGAPQLVCPGSGGLVGAQAQHRLQSQRADPFFWLVSSHIARNQLCSGLRVSSKIVPCGRRTLMPAAGALEQRRAHRPGFVVPASRQRNPCRQRS